MLFQNLWLGKLALGILSSYRLAGRPLRAWSFVLSISHLSRMLKK